MTTASPQGRRSIIPKCGLRWRTYRSSSTKLPGSRSFSSRSRASSFPRERCRSIDVRVALVLRLVAQLARAPRASPPSSPVPRWSRRRAPARPPRPRSGRPWAPARPPRHRWGRGHRSRPCGDPTAPYGEGRAPASWITSQARDDAPQQIDDDLLDHRSPSRCEPPLDQKRSPDGRVARPRHADPGGDRS